jgi:hypothetical protein
MSILVGECGQKYEYRLFAERLENTNWNRDSSVTDLIMSRISIFVADSYSLFDDIAIACCVLSNVANATCFSFMLQNAVNCIRS